MNTIPAWQTGWKAKPPIQDHRSDLAVIITGKNAKGETLQQGIGGAGQGIDFNVPGNPSIWSFGYPANPPFDGEKLIYCKSPVAYRDSPGQTLGPKPVGIGCDMHSGASGGGWFTRFQSGQGTGVLYSTNSYHYPGESIEYGPYQGDAALILWNWAKTQ